VFAVKGGRYITHMLRLREIATPLANFFASGLFNLRDKLGPILWQLPPNLRFERERFNQFLQLLPRDTVSAAALARRRERWMKGRVRLSVDAERPMRHAIEVRNASFCTPEFLELLRAHGVALVIADTAQRWPMLQDLTADFVYLRLHGDRQLYRSGYGEVALERWAERIRAWAGGGEPADAVLVGPRAALCASRDVYCFFDNTDDKLRAPVDAGSLMHKLGLRPVVAAQRSDARIARSMGR
jgi:uncharacterized protein YecE (DUF72 family)